MRCWCGYLSAARCQKLDRGAGSPPNTSLGPRPISLPSGILIHPAISPQQVWAKNWRVVPLWERGSWVPISHNVATAETYLHAKFHLDQSNRLATVHQHHRQTDNTGQRSDSIGRIILQTVAQKPKPKLQPQLFLKTDQNHRTTRTLER